MRHIQFIINTSFKNKFGNLYFLRFIFNNFKNKVFLGSKDYLNNVWGEKWIFISITKILELLQQRKNLKSKSTSAFYVQQIAYGVASFNFFCSLKFKLLSLVVQQIKLKMQENSVCVVNLNSKIKVRMLNISELEQTLLLQKTFDLY